MAGKSLSVRTNTDSGLLKLVAITSMVIDHLGASLFPQYFTMRIIGRIAFPIFAYCISLGCCRTKNIALYALRVLLLAIISQPIYVTAMGHVAANTFVWKTCYYRIDLILEHYYFVHPNVLFTLFLSILMIWTIRAKKYPLTFVVFAVTWYLRGSLDYGIEGIILILLFYCFREHPLSSLIWVAGFMVWWGTPQLRSGFVLPWNITRLYAQFYALMALPFIYIPMNTGLKINKYVFYAFYPAHLILIYILRYFA